MKNSELEKLLTPPKIISDQHKDNIIKSNEYNNKLKIYLVENYFKKPDILLIYLKKIGAEKIISISENIELLHRIFSKSTKPAPGFLPPWRSTRKTPMNTSAC